MHCYESLEYNLETDGATRDTSLKINQIKPKSAACPHDRKKKEEEKEKVHQFCNATSRRAGGTLRSSGLITEDPGQRRCGSNQGFDAIPQELLKVGLIDARVTTDVTGP